MSNKPPKIIIPGLNRGAGVPGGYVLGRRRGTGQGPAQLLDLNQLQGLGLATTANTNQTNSTTASTAHSETVSLSTSISGTISGVVSVNTAQSTSLSQISSSLSGAISTNVGQSTSLSQISSSLSGAISSTSSLSTAVSTVISGSISTVNSRIDSLSAAGGGGGVAVQDEGIAVTTATTLNFTGAGVSATNAGGGVVQVDIPAGAAASSTSLSQISSSLSSEISSRISGDSSLSTVISSEVSSRASGDTSLSTVISGSISSANSRIDSLSTAVGSGGSTELDFSPPTIATLSTERKTATAFTASAADVTGKGLKLSLNPTGAGNKTIARLHTPPGTPFQIDIRCRQTPANNAGEVGIFLNNSSNGRNLRMLQLTTGQMFSQSWSDLETFNATVGTGPTGAISGTNAWMRVTVDAGGNVAFFYSYDGAFFKALGTTTLATYLTAAGGSLDEVGIFARANGSGLTSGATIHYYLES